MNNTSAKRRRIDAAFSTLSRPFRSPLKSQIESGHQDIIQVYNENSQNPPSHTAHGNVSVSRYHNLSLSNDCVLQKVDVENEIVPISNHASNAGTELNLLLSLQRLLEKQLRYVKDELEVSEQARRIEIDSMRDFNSQTDTELINLIKKWKSTSQQAAEELFTGVRDRVNRMGGLKAWKDMQKKQHEFQSYFDEGVEQQKPDVEQQDRCMRNHLENDDISLDEFNERQVRLDDGMNEDVGIEEEFTMEMMLRFLNVDLGVIGYDKKEQRWAEEKCDTSTV